jgi:hypothetical protein
VEIVKRSFAAIASGDLDGPSPACFAWQAGEPPPRLAPPRWEWELLRACEVSLRGSVPSRLPGCLPVLLACLLDHAGDIGCLLPVGADAVGRRLHGVEVELRH